MKRESAFSPAATAILVVLMAVVLGFFFLVLAGQDIAPGAIVWAGLVGIFAAMLRSGKIGKWRRIFFVAIAVLFVPFFMAAMLQDRGSIVMSSAEVFKNETPFCHIVIPMAALPYLLTGKLIFSARLSGHFAAAYSMIAIWLIASVTVGKGWCSWVCFYGGWEDGCAGLAKKARVEIKDPDKKIRYANFATLAFVVLASLGTMSAVYCAWVCPFKTVTEFGEVNSLSSYISFIIFLTLFVGAVIVLPYLTKKRTQCMSICPFGAFQSLVDKASPYRVRVDRDRCADCGACVRVCPTLSLTEESVKEGRTLITCSKCGLCMDACPRGAIGYAFAWTKACGKPRSLLSRLSAGIDGEGRWARFTRGALAALEEVLSPKALMVWSGYLIGGIMGASFAVGTIAGLINLVTTGSFVIK